MLSGPGHLRFILQPLVALFLGVRDGRLDARAGITPFLWRLLFDRDRRVAWKSAVSAVSVPFLVAAVIDAVLQFMIFKRVRPGDAVLTGGLLVGLPYAIVRALANRYASLRRRPRGAIHDHGGLPA